MHEEEWTRAVLRDRPGIPAERLHALRAAMDRRADDCLVTGYQALIQSIVLPDPDDRHALAAAIVARANVIVTRKVAMTELLTLFEKLDLADTVIALRRLFGRVRAAVRSARP